MIQPSFHSEAQNLEGRELSRPGGTDSISHHSSSSGTPASPHCLKFRGGTRAEAELRCLLSIGSPYSRPEAQIFNASQGKVQTQSTKKENGAVTAPKHTGFVYVCQSFQLFIRMATDGTRQTRTLFHSFLQNEQMSSLHATWPCLTKCDKKQR